MCAPAPPRGLRTSGRRRWAARRASFSLQARRLCGARAASPAGRGVAKTPPACSSAWFVSAPRRSNSCSPRGAQRRLQTSMSGTRRQRTTSVSTSRRRSALPHVSALARRQGCSTPTRPTRAARPSLATRWRGRRCRRAASSASRSSEALLASQRRSSSRWRFARPTTCRARSASGRGSSGSGRVTALSVSPVHSCCTRL
mmetsp:Transcript_26837/g.80133  ORF Transcript_26837/g.80133 Transcript_26837/m.80133 type:complete len:200 (+) Transcript_26837:586-1185(+)